MCILFDTILVHSLSILNTSFPDFYVPFGDKVFVQIGELLSRVSTYPGKPGKRGKEGVKV